MIGLTAALCFVLCRSRAEASTTVSPYLELCNEYKTTNPRHTACKPFDDTWVSQYNLSMRTNVRDQVLYYINHYRGIVARGEYQGFPAAGNMRAVEWDRELEASAALHAHGIANVSWSASSYPLHDRVEDRFTTRFAVTGQNLAFKQHLNTRYGIHWHYAVRQWLTEAIGSAASIVKAYAPGRTDNFTQLVWADTEYVGCYLATSDDPTGFEKKVGFFAVHVCNFAPAGNVPGKPAYRAGAPCSRCPTGTACDPPAGLCKKTANPPSWPEEEEEKPYRKKNSAALVWREGSFCVLRMGAIIIALLHCA